MASGVEAAGMEEEEEEEETTAKAEITNEKVADNDKLGRKNTKRRKRFRDSNAPVRARTGYLLFLKERRRVLSREKPSASLPEINRELAQEWISLAQDVKQKYLQRAEEDKRRYEEEFEKKKKTDSYKQFRKRVQDLKRRRQNGTEEDNLSYDHLKPGDVPIFTMEFLEHSRDLWCGVVMQKRDAEVRRLRKEIVQMEEEENALEQRIVKLNGAIKDVETESQTLLEESEKIRSKNDSTKKCLINSLSKLPLPGCKKGPTADTIDSYLQSVQRMALDCPDQHQHFLAQIRSIVSRVKIPI